MSKSKNINPRNFRFGFEDILRPNFNVETWDDEFFEAHHARLEKLCSRYHARNKTELIGIIIRRQFEKTKLKQFQRFDDEGKPYCPICLAKSIVWQKVYLVKHWSPQFIKLDIRRLNTFLNGEKRYRYVWHCYNIDDHPAYSYPNQQKPIYPVVYRDGKRWEPDESLFEDWCQEEREKTTCDSEVVFFD